MAANAGSGNNRAQSNAIGLAVREIADDQRRALGNPEGGVLVTDVESDEAYRAGIRRGDIILMINNDKVEDVPSFEDIVDSLPPGKAVAVRVMRDGVTRFLAFTPESDEDN